MLSSGKKISTKEAQKILYSLINKDICFSCGYGGAILDYLRNIFGDGKLSVISVSYKEGDDYQMMNCAINKVVLSDPPILEMLNYTKHLISTSE
jgi:hypothetical protein